MSKPSKKRETTAVAKSPKRRPVQVEAIALAPGPVHPREGSKGSLLIDKLSTSNGASIAELMLATGWLAHTTRAALTGLRKRGFSILREPAGSGTSRYRIETEQGKGQPKRKRGVGSGQTAKTSSAAA